MTINQFIGRYEAFIDPDQHENFKRDLWTVIDKLGEDRFRQVAIEVLSDIEGSELKMYDRNIHGHIDGVIEWGSKDKPETTIQIYYWKAGGQQGMDWMYLLKSIAQIALKNG